jgi:hypothetical protein
MNTKSGQVAELAVLDDTWRDPDADVSGYCAPYPICSYGYLPICCVPGNGNNLGSSRKKATRKKVTRKKATRKKAARKKVSHRGW